MRLQSGFFLLFHPGGSCEVCGDTVRKPWVWREVQILQKRLPTNYDDRTLNRQKFFPQTAESRATVWLNGTRKRTKSYEYKSTNTLSFSWWEFRPLPLQDVSCRQGQVPLARPEEFRVVAAIRGRFHSPENSRCGTVMLWGRAGFGRRCGDRNQLFECPEFCLELAVVALRFAYATKI